MAGNATLSEVLKEDLVFEGNRVSVTLSQTGSLVWTGGVSGRIDILNDVLSASQAALTILLNVFQVKHRQGCHGRPERRVRKDVSLEFNSSSAHTLWFSAIQRCLNSSGRPKRLLVLVNPFGGKSTGRRIYEDVAEPLLKAAGIFITMRETQFQRHAKDLAKSSDLSQFDGIVCVSGDGVLTEVAFSITDASSRWNSFAMLPGRPMSSVLYEYNFSCCIDSRQPAADIVLNGLLERVDWERALQMPLGVIPADKCEAKIFSGRNRVSKSDTK